MTTNLAAIQRSAVHWNFKVRTARRPRPWLSTWATWQWSAGLWPTMSRPGPYLPLSHRRRHANAGNPTRHPEAVRGWRKRAPAARQANGGFRAPRRQP